MNEYDLSIIGSEATTIDPLFLDDEEYEWLKAKIDEAVDNLISEEIERKNKECLKLLYF